MIGLTFGRLFIMLAVIYFAAHIVSATIECNYTSCAGEEEWTCQDYPEEEECVQKREEDKEPKPMIRV